MNDALNRWSVALPIGLIALGGVMLSGCLVLPGDGGVRGRESAEAKAGGRLESPYQRKSRLDREGGTP